MGKEKGGFLTPKAIANRIKSKGLQKLRWFCQMCQKQCRDENGFKCHLTSEAHQRQLLLVAETPEKFVDGFSRQFADEFLELLRRRFGTKRVHANVVYQEYISDREHTHMNSTEWETLTDFVKWLSKESHCVVDETEKGWFISYISRDADSIKKFQAAAKKEKMEKDDDERRAQFIRGQIERAARDGSAVEAAAAPTTLNRIGSDEKIALKLVPTVSSGSSSSRPTSMLTNVLRIESEKAAERLRREDTLSTASTSTSRSNKSGVGVKRKSALEEIMEAEAKSKEKRSRMDSWLFEGIVVKIIENRLGDSVYRKKGIVREIIDNNQRAVVELIDTAKRLKLEQTQLETVLPAIGKPVLVVNGAYRGNEAVLVSIDEASFSCSVRLKDASKNGGRLIDRLPYEDVSKLM